MEDILDKILEYIRKKCIKYKSVLIVLLILSFVIYGIWYFKQDTDMQNVVNYYTKENVKGNIESGEIVVHIDGAVLKAGVYKLNSDSRLNDLIQMAGGVLDDANMYNVNLARKLKDGEKIYIYTIGEEEENNNMQNISGKVNINTAGISELITLSGIGESTAKKIISYRNENGDFNDIEEIMNVSGIGESKFNSIKEDIEI